MDSHDVVGLIPTVALEALPLPHLLRRLTAQCSRPLSCHWLPCLHCCRCRFHQRSPRLNQHYDNASTTDRYQTIAILPRIWSAHQPGASKRNTDTGLARTSTLSMTRGSCRNGSWCRNEGHVVAKRAKTENCQHKYTPRPLPTSSSPRTPRPTSTHSRTLLLRTTSLPELYMFIPILPQSPCRLL